MTTIYQSYDLLTDTRQAAVKCDQCSKRVSIPIHPDSAYEDNEKELVDALLYYGWDFELTSDGHCLCLQHKEEK